MLVRLRLLSLQEKQDYLEVVREVWAMQLDATRNRIIRIDLVVALASFAMIMPTVPAAFFVRPTCIPPELHPLCTISLLLRQLCLEEHMERSGACCQDP